MRTSRPPTSPGIATSPTERPTTRYAGSFGHAVRRALPRVPAAAMALALATTVLMATAGSAFAAADHRAAGSDDGATELRLARKFAPVVRLVTQARPCGPGEPYRPTDVDAILGNPDVALRGPWDGDNLITIAPTGADLAKATAQDYLDFPGNPLKPGCGYEQWANAVSADTQPTLYAHIVVQSDRPDRLALQYWFYYPFNDYNNKHESDWEMIQLVFATSDPQEALDHVPFQVGFSQHEGAEVAAWDDPKLTHVDGTHPVVYPAAGSHAAYYESALYLGRSAQQGFGCDNTLGPSTELRPVVKLIPSDPAQARAAYPWTAYLGHWGQHEQAFYDGPTGPAAKPDKWVTPVSWQQEQGRGTSYAVPAGGLFGTATTDFFCTGVSDGSTVVRILADNPGLVAVVLLVVAAVLIWLLSRTTWRPTAPLRLARRRAWGQIIGAARRMYHHRALLFLGIGAPIIVMGLVTAGLQALIVTGPDVAGVGRGGEAGGFRVTLAAALTYLLMGAAVVLAQAATVQAAATIDGGGTIGATEAYRMVLRRPGSLLGAFVLASALVGVLSLSVFLLPVAFVVTTLFILFVPVAVLERRSAVGVLRRSASLVRHRFWKVASLMVASVVVAAAVGPLLGTLLLLTTPAPFAVVNVISGVTFALLMPFIALTLTYAHFDAAVHAHLGGPTRRAPKVLLPEEAPLGELGASGP